MQFRLSRLFQRFRVVVIYPLFVLAGIGGAYAAAAAEKRRSVVFAAFRRLFVVIEVIFIAVELGDVGRVVFVRFAVVYIVVLDVASSSYSAGSSPSFARRPNFGRLKLGSEMLGSFMNDNRWMLKAVSVRYIVRSPAKTVPSIPVDLYIAELIP